MNAIQFIKDHGIERAREVLKAIPEKQHWFSEIMMNETGKWVVMQVVSLIHETGEKYTSTFKLCKEWQPKFTKLNDIKRIVESVDLIKKYGGIEEVKIKLNEGDLAWKDIPILRQAIADYELLFCSGESK